MKALTEKTVERKLAALGKTPKQIAANLKRLKIQGHRDNFSHCPVANFLRTKCGWSHPSVGTGECANVDLRRDDEDDYRSLPMPTAIKDFIVEFDKGAFDQLAPKPGANP